MVFLRKNSDIARIMFNHEEFSRMDMYSRMYSGSFVNSYPVVGKFITKYNEVYIIESIKPLLNSNNNNIITVSTNIKLYSLEKSIEMINDFYNLEYKNKINAITNDIVENYRLLQKNQYHSDKLENQLKDYIEKHSPEEESYSKVVKQFEKGLKRIDSKLSKNIEKDDQYKFKIRSISQECLFLKWNFTNFINEIIKNELTK